MTVLDTSGVIDLLIAGDIAPQVEALLDQERELAAPDLIVLETLSVLRREVNREALTASEATAAVSELAQLRLALFPTLGLRDRAWELRANFRMADALFIALAEELDEPLATKDRLLAKEIAKRTGVPVMLLG